MTADDKFNDHTEYTDLALSAAQDGEDRLRDTLDKVPAGAYICDPDGLITYYNQHALRLWGRAPRLHDFEDRFCGSFKLFTPDGLPVRHDQCWMAFALKSKKGYNGQEILIERPDGHRLPVLAYANPIRDSAGKLLGAVNVLVDISDRKQTEENLRKSRDAAVASSRAKDHFLAVLSHELRTPLSPVVMSIAALENDPNLPPEFHEEIVMIRRNLDLHMALLDDLLDVSRVISGKVRLTMQPVHVHEKLRHVIHNCQS
jgi:PAS domain S-box-containing protein